MSDRQRHVHAGVTRIMHWSVLSGMLLSGSLVLPVVSWLLLDPGLAAFSWQGVAAAAAMDCVFVVAAIAFLRLSVTYGRQQYPDHVHYPGAWMNSKGQQQCPPGFMQYLGFAFVVSAVTPALVLVSTLAWAGLNTPSSQLATYCLGTYLLAFIPQGFLETKLLNRSVMAPVIPILFMYYRLFQFMRSLQAVRGFQAVAATAAVTGGSSAGGMEWLQWYLLSLLTFWVFDTACVLVWLPWTYNWQLQTGVPPAGPASTSGAMPTGQDDSTARKQD